MSRFLLRHPAIQRSLIMGGLFGTGDIIAQYVTLQDNFAGEYDKRRTLRATAYGGLIFGPVASFITYPFVNRLGTSLPLAKQVLVRVTVDQGIIAPFLYVPMYFTASALMEGESPAIILDRVQQNWTKVVLTGWTVWIPTQILNFTLVPADYRLIAGGAVGLVWSIYLAVRNKRTADIEHASNLNNIKKT